VIQDVPQLRIIDQDLSKRAKEKQNALAFRLREKKDNAGDSMLVRAAIEASPRRPCPPQLSGWQLHTDLEGSARLHHRARNKGTCFNRLNIRRDALESSMLSDLRTHLMTPTCTRSSASDEPG
jgi:site-specific DNA recombinase